MQEDTRRMFGVEQEKANYRELNDTHCVYFAERRKTLFVTQVLSPAF